ncbi:uncharacterized protein LOC135695123 [Rhopilema esculentum]|uniref:uncharacterized protein LOC135695123 n=1 Tax=Rhopilema esculentum TaxID=499914 RepID=UPI0031DF0463
MVRGENLVPFISMSPLCVGVSVLLFMCMTPSSASLHPKENGINNDTSVCGNQRIFNGTSGVIKSPGYPNRYPLNVFCSYHIVVAENLRIELRWNEFDVDGDMPGCNSSYSEDFVEVYVGCEFSRRYLTKFCSRNSGLPHTIYSLDSCLTLNFFANPGAAPKTSKGFSAFYKTTPKHKPLRTQSCNRTLLEGSGVIHSSYWPQTYNILDIDSCAWKLKLDGVMAVKFTIMDLYTNSYYSFCHYSCYKSDVVSIEGVASLYATQRVKQSFCGKCTPFVYEALYSELIINWKKKHTYYTEPRGFVIGFVSYVPVTTMSTFALWQYVLLATCCAASICIPLLLFCRYKRGGNQSSPHRLYSRLVNVGTDTNDIGTATDNANGQTEDEVPGSPPAGNDLETDIADQRRPSLDVSTTCYGSADSILAMNRGRFDMRDFAAIGTAAQTSCTLDSVYDVSECRRRVPIFTDTVSVEALFHPNAPYVETTAPNAPIPDSLSSYSDLVHSHPPAAENNGQKYKEVDGLARSIADRTTEENELTTEHACHNEAIYNARPDARRFLEWPIVPDSTDNQATATEQPPPYDQIYNELQSLAFLVDELVSDFSQEQSD